MWTAAGGRWPRTQGRSYGSQSGALPRPQRRNSLLVPLPAVVVVSDSLRWTHRENPRNAPRWPHPPRSRCAPRSAPRPR
eukprot:scaffold328365_cov135-Tisochrysis_lutea.AAC.1